MANNELIEPVVRIRGLPFSAREEDVIEFFKEVKLVEGSKSVTFTYGRDGRATGEAYMVCQTMEDAQKALARHRDHMGKRYLEVFPSSFKELDYVSGRSVASEDFVVRLRGLPFDVDKPEIMTFFDGLEIAPNGIGLLLDNMGRSTGEAFVQFTSQEMLDRARAKHMQKIGHRYIEIFKSNMLEANNSIRRQIEINEGRIMSENFGSYGRGGGRMGGYGARSSPYQRPGMGSSMGRDGNMKSAFGSGNRYSDGGSYRSGGIPGDDWHSTTGHSVHMRGLPFSIMDSDIYEFFAPLIPVHVEIHVNPVTGRLTGEADVDFASYDEVKEAMKKDRERIGQRYIELFLNSSVGRRDPIQDVNRHMMNLPAGSNPAAARMPVNQNMPRRYPNPTSVGQQIRSSGAYPPPPTPYPGPNYAYPAYPPYPTDTSGYYSADPSAFGMDPNQRAYGMPPTNPSRQMYEGYGRGGGGGGGVGGASH